MQWDDKGLAVQGQGWLRSCRSLSFIAGEKRLIAQKCDDSLREEDSSLQRLRVFAGLALSLRCKHTGSLARSHVPAKCGKHP